MVSDIDKALFLSHWYQVGWDVDTDQIADCDVFGLKTIDQGGKYKTFFNIETNNWLKYVI